MLEQIPVYDQDPMIVQEVDHHENPTRNKKLFAPHPASSEVLRTSFHFETSRPRSEPPQTKLSVCLSQRGLARKQAKRGLPAEGGGGARGVDD